MIPAVLYKYRSVTEETKELDRVRQTIVEDKVWFPSPSDLNDPFDCRLSIAFDGNDHEWRDRFRALFRRAKPEQTAVEREIEVSRAIAGGHHKGPVQQRRFLDYMQEQINQIGVFCLSEPRDSLLMWSYYANGHQGVCLGFANLVGDGAFAEEALKVVYSSSYPTVQALDDDPERASQTALLTKAEAWSHEREWRIIDTAVGPGLRQLGPNMLVEVIIGARLKEHLRREITGWIKERQRKPVVYQAVPGEKQYRLEFQPVAV